ncbi:hypothetical protein [Sphingomonas montana]|uniref:hypothetical protein n=1 Tax=Sphingomonas montana TaxID=1843236 RepID=UPI00096E4938|nr:hypothetical protein [Sphingomonas montana]
MSGTDHPPSAAELRLRALSRWDNEGGAIATAPSRHADVAPLSPAELIQLRIRVIALENMLIAVLADGTDRQRDVARDIAAYIAPRSGFTHHPLTIEASRHMTALVDRAVHYRTIDS